MLITLAGCAAPGPRSTPDDSQTRAPEAAGDAQAVSLLGAPLYARPADDATPALEANLAAAQQALADNPDDPDRVIWLGRRLGYLWRAAEAIDVFTQGLIEHPDHAALLRHRGHRYLTLRMFAEAERDLARAAELIEGQPDEIEQDGAPNRLNIPLTTLRFNVWYHLGLARYLQGDYDGALTAYRACMKASWRHDDNLVATGYWLYLTLMRLDRESEATGVLAMIHDDMNVIEDTAYHRLLLMYKSGAAPLETIDLSSATPQDYATLGYGIGAWYQFRDQPAEAARVFEQVIARGPWPAFGYIAAEVQLAGAKAAAPPTD
jgi:tetratricopeptide (TPR) repeat protein